MGQAHLGKAQEQAEKWGHVAQTTIKTIKEVVEEIGTEKGYIRD
jgi:hypothetical protein